MKLSRTAVAVYVGLIFLSGLVLGALGQRLYMVHSVDASSVRRNPDEWRKRYTEEMRTRLSLNAGQMSQLNGILDRTRQEVKDARERQKPEMDAIRDRQVNNIRAILSEQQRAEFEKMREERERNVKKMGSGPGF
jgi:hypothetical protein